MQRSILPLSMSAFRKLAKWYSSIATWKKISAAVLFVVLGVLTVRAAESTAWSACAPFDVNNAPSSCTIARHSEWWTYPGVTLGIVLVILAMGIALNEW